jgi:hypothetical protein
MAARAPRLFPVGSASCSGGASGLVSTSNAVGNSCRSIRFLCLGFFILGLTNASLSVDPRWEPGVGNPLAGLCPGGPRKRGPYRDDSERSARGRRPLDVRGVRTGARGACPSANGSAGRVDMCADDPCARRTDEQSRDHCSGGRAYRRPTRRPKVADAGAFAGALRHIGRMPMAHHSNCLDERIQASTSASRGRGSSSIVCGGGALAYGGANKAVSKWATLTMAHGRGALYDARP